MWDLSSMTRDQTTSPALEGGFLTTGQPGKSSLHSFLLQKIIHHMDIVSFVYPHQLTDIWAVSMFGLLRMMPVWTFLYKVFYKHVFSSLGAVLRSGIAVILFFQESIFRAMYQSIKVKQLDAGVCFKIIQKKGTFSGGLVIKNLPSNVADMGSILGKGTKIPQAKPAFLMKHTRHNQEKKKSYGRRKWGMGQYKRKSWFENFEPGQVHKCLLCCLYLFQPGHKNSFQCWGSVQSDFPVLLLNSQTITL